MKQKPPQNLILWRNITFYKLFRYKSGRKIIKNCIRIDDPKRLSAPTTIETTSNEIHFKVTEFIQNQKSNLLQIRTKVHFFYSNIYLSLSFSCFFLVFFFWFSIKFPLSFAAASGTKTPF